MAGPRPHRPGRRCPRRGDLVDAVEQVVVELHLHPGQQVLELGGCAGSQQRTGDSRVRDGEGHGLAEAGAARSSTLAPQDALVEWAHRFTGLLASRRGLASALHSGHPAFAGLPDFFLQRLGPVLAALLDAAVASGAVRADVRADDLLHALTQLSQPGADHDLERTRRTVSVLLDGLLVGRGQ